MTIDLPGDAVREIELVPELRRTARRARHEADRKHADETLEAVYADIGRMVADAALAGKEDGK